MRTLRFSAFLVVVFVQYAFAQATQPTVTQQPAAVQVPDKSQPQPEPSTSSQQNSQNNKDHEPASQAPNQFRFNLVPPKNPPRDQKLPTGTVDRGFRAFAVPGLHPLFQSRRVIPVNTDDLTAGDPQGKFDPGIYARGNASSGTGTFCGSIVSYNFSETTSAEVPKLESVTTCTPSNTVVPRRAQGHETKPVTPQLQRAGFMPL